MCVYNTPMNTLGIGNPIPAGMNTLGSGDLFYPIKRKNKKQVLYTKSKKFNINPPLLVMTKEYRKRTK